MGGVCWYVKVFRSIAFVVFGAVSWHLVVYDVFDAIR